MPTEDITQSHSKLPAGFDNKPTSVSPLVVVACLPVSAAYAWVGDGGEHSCPRPGPRCADGANHPPLGLPYSHMTGIRSPAEGDQSCSVAGTRWKFRSQILHAAKGRRL